MTTKHSLYIVTIHGTEHAVRATGKRVAQAIAIDNRIDTRLAETDDIIRIVRSGQPIIGDFGGVRVIDKTASEIVASDNDRHLPHAYVKE